MHVYRGLLGQVLFSNLRNLTSTRSFLPRCKQDTTNSVAGRISVEIEGFQLSSYLQLLSNKRRTLIKCIELPATVRINRLRTAHFRFFKALLSDQIFRCRAGAHWFRRGTQAFGSNHPCHQNQCSYTPDQSYSRGLPLKLPTSNPSPKFFN